MLDVTIPTSQPALSGTTNATTLQTSWIAIGSAHLIKLYRTSLSCLLLVFSLYRTSLSCLLLVFSGLRQNADKINELSNIQLATLFLPWVVAIPFVKVLIYSTESIVTETGLSRDFIGGIIWPVIINLPLLVVIIAHSTPVGAVQALQNNPASFYSLRAVCEVLGRKLYRP